MHAGRWITRVMRGAIMLPFAITLTLTAAAAATPPAPAYSTDWTLGKPDLIVTLPAAYELPAAGTGGKDVYRNFVLPLALDTPRFVRAVELRPGNPRVVHHAFLMLDNTG